MHKKVQKFIRKRVKQFSRIRIHLVPLDIYGVIINRRRNYSGNIHRFFLLCLGLVIESRKIQRNYK